MANFGHGIGPCNATESKVLLMQGGGPGQMWVLKQDVHRGKGVHVMKQQQAIHEVLLLFHLLLHLSASPSYYPALPAQWPSAAHQASCRYTVC